VTFRTLDLGGDKVLPYVTAEREENPALGWRAVRIGLDRPALLRYQLRALVNAAAGRRLRVMFPLVTTVEEFDAARELVDRELDWAKARGRAAPSRIEVGVMVEAPSLAWSVPALKGKADFLSIGTNDLMQYFFAADRGNARVADRYDVLSPPALRFLKRIRDDAAEAGIPLSICGEAAGRPLEAMAFVALGFDSLSMPASGVGPVKRMLLSLDAGEISDLLTGLIEAGGPNLRKHLKELATHKAVTL
jgi:phosphotransferase system enzyme I (PtsP)